MFLTQYGYRVLEAIDGYEGLRLCEQHAGMLDIIVTDVRMPGLHGPELHNLVRAAELHDIGKMAIPDALLSKPGPLDEALAPLPAVSAGRIERLVLAERRVYDLPVDWAALPASEQDRYKAQALMWIETHDRYLSEGGA